VEACPRDALVMTDIYEFSQRTKEALVLHKEDLMRNGKYYQERETAT
jgi:NADH-quinone oxidoreductase subunit I